MDYSSKEDIVEYVFDKIKLFILPSESNNYKSNFLQGNALLYCVVLLLVLKIVLISVSFNFPPNAFFADITKSSLENFVNQTRQSLGLNALTENKKLNQAAQAKAENMVSNNYFSHTSPSGVTPWSWFLKAGYNYKYAGENLAVGFFDSKEVYDAWLNSPSHKANIVNPNYTEVGTAVLEGFGNNNAIIVVQEFGTQLPLKSAVKNSSSKPVATIQPNASTTPKATNPVGQEVLSQSTQSQNFLEAGGDSLSSSPKFVSYDYNALLQDIAYGISLIIIGTLCAVIFFSLGSRPLEKKLVLRSALILVLLSLSVLLNKSFIISIIPHQIII
ncbi:MAG: CAP domain-containing protein [Candidatus Staskawiczbacteria bacterium]|nr:CAP domain-containing protein [Candidatus Staskawiczbacteria bacterium]